MDKSGNGNIIGEIYCDAQNCIYNEQGSKCAAGNISVGTKNASSANETLCGTFTLDSNAK